MRVAAEHGMTSLAQVLADPDPAARTLALQTIGELSPERAAPLLASVLHDPEPSVRVAAARTAEHVGASGAVFSLILALDDPDVSVRQAAAHAVQQLTGRPVTFDETSDSTARQATIEELKVWWKEQRLAQLNALAGGSARS